jgi:hypothetical protein
MGRVVMVVGMGMGVGRVDQVARRLMAAVSEHDVDLRRPDAAAVHLFDAYTDVGKPESKRQTLKPFGRRTGGDKRAEQHVAADPGGRVEDGKASI